MSRFETLYIRVVPYERNSIEFQSNFACVRFLCVEIRLKSPYEPNSTDDVEFQAIFVSRDTCRNANTQLIKIDHTYASCNPKPKIRTNVPVDRRPSIIFSNISSSHQLTSQVILQKQCRERSFWASKIERFWPTIAQAEEDRRIFIVRIFFAKSNLRRGPPPLLERT